MHIYSKLVAVLFFALIGFAVWTLTGCTGRSVVGSPGYNDPMADPSPYEDTEEFEYLVDLETALNDFKDSFSDIATMMEIPVFEGIPEGSSIMEEIGLVQDSIMAEANESMVHARGEYTLDNDELSFLDLIAEAGAAEIRLPARYHENLWVGHLFVANPGVHVQIAFDALDETFTDIAATLGGENSYGMTMNMDSMLRMYGFESAEDIYGWMGTELIMFSIVNPDFDPDAGASYDNYPIHQVLAISSDNPSAGLDLFENFFGNSFMGMVGLSASREEFDGYDAVIIPPPDFRNSMMSEYYTEEMLEQYDDLPDNVVVALDDYIFMADQAALEAALEYLEDEDASTGRSVTIEFEQNWDLTVDSWKDGNPLEYIADIGSIDLTVIAPINDLMMQIYSQTRELNELGMTRASILIQDGEHFSADVLTSRESIRFFELVTEIFEEMPEEVWEEIGRRIGEAFMDGMGGMGGMGGMDREDGEDGEDGPPVGF